MPHMQMMMFRVHLEPGSLGNNLITAETAQETQAQILTKAEAEAVGFSGIPDPPAGSDLRLVICAPQHARRIQNQLNMSAAVAQFDAHEINM